MYDVGNACVSDTDSDSVIDYQVFIVHCNFDTFDFYYLIITAWLSLIHVCLQIQFVC